MGRRESTSLASISWCDGFCGNFSSFVEASGELLLRRFALFLVIFVSEEKQASTVERYMTIAC